MKKLLATILCFGLVVSPGIMADDSGVNTDSHPPIEFKWGLKEQSIATVKLLALCVAMGVAVVGTNKAISGVSTTVSTGLELIPETVKVWTLVGIAAYALTLRA